MFGLLWFELVHLDNVPGRTSSRVTPDEHGCVEKILFTKELEGKKYIVNISLMALDYDEGVSAITEKKLKGTNMSIMSLPKSFLNDDVPFPKV